jgi:hypothetical protein
MATPFETQITNRTAWKSWMPSPGGDETFTTIGCSPTVITGLLYQLPPEKCGGEGVNLELTGTIDPNGLATSYYFEYIGWEPEGPESKVIGEYNTPTESAGSGTNPVEVGAAITVKDPPIPCYEVNYRLVGVSSAGTSYGESLWGY